MIRDKTYLSDIRKLMKERGNLPETIVRMFFETENLPEEIVILFKGWLASGNDSERKWLAVENIFNEFMEPLEESELFEAGM